MEGTWQGSGLNTEGTTKHRHEMKSLDSNFSSLTPRHFVTFAFWHTRPLLCI